PFEAPQTRRLDAGRSEGRQARPRASRCAVAGRIKGIVENNRSHDRTDHGLARHMAKAMAATAGSLRVGCLNGRARGACNHRAHWIRAAATGKRRKIMKK